jgi:DNA polymerase-3 subunit epsilon
MKLLFFDVETTGLPENYKAHYSQINNWPRIVQLSWLIADSGGEILKESDNIIKVDFPIPAEVSRIHGITDAISQSAGVDIAQVLNCFLKDLANAEYIICHNVGFDLPVLQSELLRANMDHAVEKKTFCTMVSSTSYCQLPGNRGFKWPRLSELYQICFCEPIQNSHNAIVDVRATHRIFFHLLKYNIFLLK